MNKPHTTKNKGILGTNKDSFRYDLNQISRIMIVLLEKNSVGKTNLSLETNINYAKLLKHLKRLEEKRFIVSVIEDGKTNVKLSKIGRDFTMMLLLVL
ncbi:MAG TPA: hypothetical protein VFJ23_00675 [Candidatus Nitrosotalea sp.]|nr:hypothetical protein [Candidatus Nitrosotalea sp.]